jgi:thiol:disulfide interchange protein
MPQRFLSILAAILLLGSTAWAQLDEPLVPDITPSQSAMRPGDNAVVAVVLNVPEGYHAQSHTPTKPEFIAYDLKLKPSPDLVIGAPLFPKGKPYTTDALGTLDVYDGRVVVYVPLRVKTTRDAGEVVLEGTLTYQICDDQLCYRPQNQPFTLRMPLQPATSQVQQMNPELFKDFNPAVFASMTDATGVGTEPTAAADSDDGPKLFGFALDKNAYLLAFAGALVVGVIFNVVPCVLPVLPLKAIGFYEAAMHSRARCVTLGLAFSAGIVATFAALALIVVVFKVVDWGALFSKPAFVIPLALILIVLAIGQFGFFGINVPTFLYNVTYKNDTIPGNFAHGAMTALLSTPCTFGMFFVLLVWATTQSAIVGVALLMTVGVGMASPYLLLATFPELARRFPRTGPWPEVIKQMMAFLLLATAVYFIRPILPDSVRGPGVWWVIWGFIAAAGVFLIVRAVQISPRARPVTIAVVVAALISVPTFALAKKLANPPVDWVHYTPDGLAKARAAGKPVFVKFTADWCANCQTVELTVFGDMETVKWLREHNVEPIKADLTKDNAEGWPLLTQVSPVGAIPITAVWRPGDEKPRVLSGIYSSEDLKKAIGG